MSILTLLRQCQLVLKSHEWAIKATQSDRLSSGMREVVGKAARVEHIVGKTLGMTASSFVPVQSRRRHYSLAESKFMARWIDVRSGWSGACAHEN